MKKLISLFVFVLTANLLIGQSYDAGETYNGTNNYVTYYAGNIPLIISVPHGGDLTPSSIPDRSCSGCTTVTDAFTRQLGLSLRNAINELTGCEVNVVVNELKRTKLDANRAISEAALGNSTAELAWNEYHAFLDSAKAEVVRTWGRGLFIDLHGHGHDIQRLELGYRISGTNLRKSDDEINSIDLTTLPIRTLIDSTGMTTSRSIRGSSSLGALFDDRGYDAVPSSNTPFPNSGESYFSGGYNTDRHGSRDGGFIDAIQIECNQDVRFDTSDRERFADSLAVVLIEFIRLHYHDDIISGACQPTSLRSNLPIKEMEVFPNPVCGRLNFTISDDVESIFVVNNLGQTVYRAVFADEIDVSGLPNGLYYLFVESKDYIYRQRVVVQCQ